MALGASLPLLHQASVISKFGRNNQFKSSEMKSWRHMSTLHVSSFRLRKIINKSYKPIYRFNPMRVRASALPVSLQSIPLVKSTSLALTRSYNAISASPVTVQVIPAIGLIAFAAWGLVPLMHSIRNLFHTENSWTKSKTYHFSRSYLQPLLLWTGTTLICRAFDPVVFPSEATQAVKLRAVHFFRCLSTVLALTWCFTSLIEQTQKSFVESKVGSSDEARNMGFQFVSKAVYTAAWAAAVILFLELLGMSTQKGLTAGGLGTVLITLAGREIFTNFLSSVMIHATRPFVVNEWIQTKIEGYEVSGTVEHVGWWSPTVIRGDDREAVHIPNHKFTVSVVRNLSQKTHWRIKTHLAISHLDVSKINNIVADMRKVLAKHPQIEQQRLHRRVFLENINPENQALLILISCFVKTSHFEEYLCVKESILLDLLRVISHHRARLATPIRTVQKYYGDADMENIPYAETYRAGNPSSRPLLLVEPQVKINGDEKPKTQPHKSDSKPVNQSESSPNNPDNNSNSKQQNKKTNMETANGTENGTGVESNGSNSCNVNSKGESEKEQVKRPSFEDNIVLGVALEGSKRTLPIDDEEMSAGANSSEHNEMDKVGPAPAGKDKKAGGQGKVVDQREPDRSHHEKPPKSSNSSFLSGVGIG